MIATTPVVAIVCGSRDGQPGWRLVERALDVFDGDIMPLSHVIVGSYRGTDREAFDWAMRRERDGSVLNAKWKTGVRKGPAEGPIRNRRMPQFALRAQVCLSFPGDRGTHDMRDVARSIGLPLWLCEVGHTFDWQLEVT